MFTRNKYNFKQENRKIYRSVFLLYHFLFFLFFFFFRETAIIWQCSRSKSENLQTARRNLFFKDVLRLEFQLAFRRAQTHVWAASWQNQQNGMCTQRRLRHPPSLIRVFAVRMKKAWVLSYPLSAQRRLWSDWADAQADQSSLFAWRKLGSLATHWAHSEDSDQTGRMSSLIWVVAGRTIILLVLSWGGSSV